MSVTAGLLTGSAALVSWGLDSTVEATSAGTLIWRLRGEAKGADRRTVLHRKKVALSVVACAFWIVVAAILYDAVSAFLLQEAPGFNWWGIAMPVRLVVNPFLAWGKYRYGKRLVSPALKYDAKDTLICQYFRVVAVKARKVPHSRPSGLAQRTAASRPRTPSYLSDPRHLSAASRRCGQARTRSTASRSVGRYIRTTGSPAELSRPFVNAKRCVTPAR